VIGRPAPDLRFLDKDGNPVELVSLRGRPVVLVFLRWLG
jgi:peroxiredoxin